MGFWATLFVVIGVILAVLAGWGLGGRHAYLIGYALASFGVAALLVGGLPGA